MAGESTNQRARTRRKRQANIADGRRHRHVVKLSDAEEEDLTRRAEEAGVSVARLLVESAQDSGRVEAGRAHAAMQLLELDTELRRIGSNLNQLVRYAHQQREIPEHLGDALHAVTRACLSVDATARWVMGLTPAVTAKSVDPAVDLLVDEEWAAAVDPDGAGV
ncbi:MobC family plasmid mobilization relaxosome protein (plasmid) [Nocardia sp. NBC_01377]|uniref:plasmid mobilization protein n=1 Tax=Nocardia sp. NBC_01377 TaxID=2903595 RepID=UPI003248DC5B